jgi:3D (Asp-Asp-Asp) domain-containing protein
MRKHLIPVSFAIACVVALTVLQITSSTQRDVVATSHHPATWKHTRVLVTAYVVGSDAGCFTFHDRTATGTVATIGTAAVDPRVFQFGTRFRIPGYGYAIARDTGSYIKGRHIDIVLHSCQRALQWGEKTLTIAYVPVTKSFH